MDKFGSVDEALDFAIEREQKAHDFYTHWANETSNIGMRQLFQQFATEELGHKAKLEAIKKDGQLAPDKKQVLDLKIGDYLVDVEPSAEIDYQSALILAMKREKAAFRFYSDLAAAATDGNLRSTFLGLAQEEAKHKLRFELEYDENILTEG
jgi:rubrerythrin